MKFEKGKSYTHKNMLDMIIKVLEVYPTNKNCSALCIRWFNRRGLDIGIMEDIKIKNKDLPFWYEWES